MKKEEIEKLIADLPGVEQTEPDGTKYHLISHDDLVAFAEKLSGCSVFPKNHEGLDEVDMEVSMMAQAGRILDEQFKDEPDEIRETFLRSWRGGFEAGVSYAFGQGRTFEREFDGFHSIEITLDKYVLGGAGFSRYDKVIVQIRKKNK